MGVNAYFGHRQTNILYATPNCGPGTYKFEVDYYRQTYCYPEKLDRIQKKLEKAGQEVMYSSKCYNYNHMDSFDNETCEKLIWTSGEGCINKNTIRKQVIPKNNTNKVYPSSALGFGCYPHKETCDIFSEDLVSQILQEFSSKN